MADPHFPLSAYPYVVVRLACIYCKRRGSYRLARLAAKYGAEADIYERVLPSIAGDCAYWKEIKRGPNLGCGAHFPDLERPQPPPDLPPAMRGLRIVGGKG